MAIDVGEAVAYLSLEMTAFNTGLQSAQTALQSFSDNTSALGSGLTAVGSVASNVGNSLTRNLTVPILSLGESSIQAYRDFESAFAGVRKTVDDSQVELIGGYEVLSSAIEDMSTRTASSAEEIAGVMEAAGQLGVPLGKAGEDIINFTETMVMLGDSTNLSAQEAALAIARFANITGTAWQDIDNLGATIVDLGNNFAAQEDEIALMSTRLASAGTVAGLTETEILALATAMTSVGIRAEAGGTAMSTTLAQIEKAVSGYIAGDDGATKKVEKFGEVAGMTAEEFATAWKEKPAEALESFLVGIGQLDEKGESAILVLDELGMSGVRQSNMLKALGLAGGMLTKSIDTANTAWEENTALTTEAEKRYGTLDSQISQLNEEWKSMKRDLAEILIPALKELMDIAKQLITWWKGLSEEQQQMIVKFAAIAAAVGPVLMVFGNLLAIVGQVVNLFSIGKNAISLLSDSLLWAKTAGISLAQSLSISGSGLGGVLSSLVSSAGPIMAVVAGLAVLVAAIVDLWRTNEEFRENVSRIWNSIVSVFQSIIDALTPLFELLGYALGVVFEAIKNLIAILAEALAPAFEAIAGIIERLSPILEVLGSIIGVTLVGAAYLLAGAIEWVANIMASAIEIITSVIDIILNLIDVIVGFATGDMEKVKNALGNIWEEIKNIFKGALDFILNLLFGWCSDLVDAIKNLNFDILDNIGQLFSDAVNAIGNFFSNALNMASEAFQNIIQGIANFVGNVTTAIFNFFSNMISNFVNFVNNIVNGVGSLRDRLFSAIGNFISSTISTVGEFLSNMLASIGEFLTSLPSRVAQGLGQVLTMIAGFVQRFFNAGANLFNSLWKGLKSVWDSIWDWIKGIWEKITGVFSDIKSGFSNAFSGSGWNGSHANGLDYVPYDGYVAQLHQGERVLTKQEAKDYNNGNNNQSNGGDTYNFYNTKPDPYEYARQMKRVKRELQFG